MSALFIKNAGVQSTLQDEGRFGYLHMGITESGSMDRRSARCANVLCGNSRHEAVIEVTLGGLELQARGDSVIAITGGFATVQINGDYVEMWRSHQLQEGDSVQLGFCQRGARLYVAVSGGIQSEAVLQSRSTTVQWGIGGLSGGVLDAGDELPCGNPSDDRIRRLSVPHRPRFEDELHLKVLACCQYKEFSKEQRRAFFSTVYKVDHRCNRMGYRLLGDAITPSSTGMYSEGLTVGAIQVPPDGQPIVLMRDHQSIGGYPKIASLLSAEIDRLSQCVAGQRVRFVPVCYGQAQHHTQRYLESLDGYPT